MVSPVLSVTRTNIFQKRQCPNLVVSFVKTQSYIVWAVWCSGYLCREAGRKFNKSQFVCPPHRKLLPFLGRRRVQLMRLTLVGLARPYTDQGMPLHAIHSPGDVRAWGAISGAGHGLYWRKGSTIGCYMLHHVATASCHQYDSGAHAC